MANDIIVKPVDKLKAILNADSIQTQFKNALKENAPAFVSSIVELFNSDSYLQQCDPNLIVMEAFKAATLKLPINKQLGFAYIVPYKKNNVQIPQFQIGYKGYIQLAMRTGQYRYINADVIREGITIETDILSGKVTFSGKPTSNNAIGYFAYLELLNGFSKTVYMTKEAIISHAERYSKSFKKDTSAWHSNFDEMAIKTPLRRLLSHYGILSTEMISALASDNDYDGDETMEQEIAANANAQTIDIVGKTVDMEPVDQAEDLSAEPFQTAEPGF